MYSAKVVDDKIVKIEINEASKIIEENNSTWFRRCNKLSNITVTIIAIYEELKEPVVFDLSQ